jgi:hypothetical protein
MALQVKKGTFTAPTVTGNFAVTGVGFQGKALILWGNRNANNTLASNSGFGYGFAATSLQRGTSSFNASNAVTATTTHNERYGMLNRAYTISSATLGLAAAKADFVSWDTDGFTLNFTVAGTALQIHYIVLGGTDLTNAFVGSFTEPIVTGNLGITGVGFRPDLVLTTAWSQGDNVNAASLNYNMSAFASTTKRGALAITSQDVTSPTNANSYERNDKAIVSLNSVGTLRTEADFVSMDTDGFTLNYSTTVGSGAQPVVYLALKGGKYWVGSDTQKTSTGTQAKTGVGFTPTGLLAFGGNKATATTIDATLAKLTVGGSDGTTQGATFNEDVDNQTTSVAAQVSDTTKVLKHATSPSTVNAEASVSSFDSDGYTLNWSTADATAREFIVIAFGSTAAFPAYSTLIKSETSLISYWRLNELTPGTGTAADELGAHNGTYVASPASTAGNVSNDTNKAVSFNGSTQYVTVSNTGNPFTFTGTAAYSVECLAYIRSRDATFRRLIDHTKATGSEGWSLNYNNATGNFLRFERFAGGTGTWASAADADIPLSTWLHVVATYDGTNQRLYINGVLKGGPTASPNSLIANATDPLMFANGNEGGRFGDVILDEISIYNTALSGTAITSHYNSYVSGAAPSVQLVRPISDITVGGWTTAPLWSKIDEVSADDTDFITSTGSAVADVSEVLIGSLSDPASSTGHKVRYRYQKDTGVGTVNLTVRLMQGTTEIASWTHTNIANGWTTVEQTLTSGQADSITNYADLRLRFESTTS